MRKRWILSALMLSLGTAGLHASVVYNLRDGRYFPDGPGAPFNTNQGAAFTSTTSDSLQISFSSNPGNPTANTFDGLATIGTGPFVLGANNAATINTATTTFSNLGILSIVESGITESGVTVTGGSGTGYLLPTFHVQGTLSDSNPNASVNDLICAGNNMCLLSSIFGAFTSGNKNVDGFYTPSIGNDTAFQFGTPFTFFFFFGSGIDGNGNPGGTTTADLTLQFAGVQVVDASGRPIPGAQINSQFLGVVAPEPATAEIALGGMAVLGASLAARKRRGRALK